MLLSLLNTASPSHGPELIEPGRYEISDQPSISLFTIPSFPSLYVIALFPSGLTAIKASLLLADEREETNVIIIDQEADIDIVIEVEEEPEPVVEQIFDVVEENPEFIGGMAKLYEYLGKNIQYPEMAKENGIQGKVFVQFVVWKDGTIKDVRVVKGVHKTLDSEAQRVVKSMPKWTPGRQRGTAVNARFTLPIKFRIS